MSELLSWWAVAPWQTGQGGYFWALLMGFLVTASCGLVGNYLLVRRLSLMGDTISHSILPGLVLAFLWTGRRTSWVMFVGAVIAALVTVFLVDLIQKGSRIKQDAAMSVVFTVLFALGVLLVSIFAHQVDLDQDCVLYGEIAFVPLETLISVGGVSIGPPSVVRMGIVFLFTLVSVVLFNKELLLSSFDPGLSTSSGYSAQKIHLGLMAMVAIIVVSAFESVGAILVVAMLIFPGATASLITDRLNYIHVLTIIQSALSTLGGMYLALWLDTSIAASMVVVSMCLFALVWFFNPSYGLISTLVNRGVSKDKTLETE